VSRVLGFKRSHGMSISNCFIWLRKKFHPLRRQFIFISNRFRIAVQIQRTGRGFTIVLPEACRRIVKWSKWTLGIGGVLVGLVVMPQMAAFAVGLIGYLTILLLERFVFSSYRKVNTLAG